jgi:hypothetical protein
MNDRDRLTELTTRAEALAAELTATVNAIRSAASAPAAPPAEPVRRTLLTIEQAGEALCLFRCAVYELRSGALASVQIGTRRRVPVRAIDAYVSAVTGAA